MADLRTKLRDLWQEADNLWIFVSRGSFVVFFWFYELLQSLVGNVLIWGRKSK